MAEFEHVDGGGSSPRSKKLKLNKKNIVLIGGAVMGVFFLVLMLSRGRTTTQVLTEEEQPINDATTQAMLQNNSNIVLGQVDQALNMFSNDLLMSQEAFQEDVSKQITDIGKSQQSYTDAQNKKIADQLASLTKQLQGLQNTDKTTTKPAPKPTPAKPSPKPTPAKKPTPQPAGIKYATPKGGWDGNSIVDYLKSKGMKNDFNSRKRLAGQMGITNYKGTASQNTALLKKLKS